MASDRSVRTDTPQPARPEPCVGLGGRRGRGSQGESSNPSFTAAWGLALSPGIAPGVTAGLPLTANGLTANKTLAGAAFPSQQTPISGTQRPLTANETASHGKRKTANIRGEGCINFPRWTKPPGGSTGPEGPKCLRASRPGTQRIFHSNEFGDFLFVTFFAFQTKTKKVVAEG